MPVQAEQDTDPVLDALDDVVGELQEVAHGSRQIAKRAATIRRERSKGLPYRLIVSEAAKPLIVERLSEMLERIRRAGSKLRRAEARALYEEGVTTEQIARLFGVSRQRVSALLRHAHQPPPDSGPTKNGPANNRPRHQQPSRRPEP